MKNTILKTSLILMFCLSFLPALAQDDEGYSKSEIELKEEVERIHQDRLRIEDTYWKDKADWQMFNQTQAEEHRNHLLDQDFQRRYY